MWVMGTSGTRNLDNSTKPRRFSSNQGPVTNVLARYT
jgi:hypothetical protein